MRNQPMMPILLCIQPLPLSDSLPGLSRIPSACAGLWVLVVWVIQYTLPPSSAILTLRIMDSPYLQELSWVFALAYCGLLKVCVKLSCIFLLYYSGSDNRLAGAIMMSYPLEQSKGRYISWFWMIFNLGAVIGSLV